MLRAFVAIYRSESGKGTFRTIHVIRVHQDVRDLSWTRRVLDQVITGLKLQIDGPSDF
jgi:hypothetical protein